LANAFTHVYLDLGLTFPHVGARATAILAETLELAPFHKLLYSSDAFGLAELYLLAAALFRDALDEVLPALHITGADQERITRLIAADNAHRVYAIGGG
jgi:predicted TIM-barrel fold metal-dependent hydrolase